MVGEDRRRPEKQSTTYNEPLLSYNAMEAGVTSHLMKISRNGQVSIPADARARWRTEHVVVVDLGDRVVVRPLPDDPIGDLVGKYAKRGPTTLEARRASRTADDHAERRKRT